MNVQGYMVTIRWASYNDEYRLMKALFDINMAKNLDQFKAAMDPLTGWDHVLQNIVYADQAGNIGFIAAGKIPLRGNTNSYGILPLNGTNSTNNWQGWIPLAELPQEWNPSRGYVCTANSFTTSIGASYPHYLSWKFIDPNRQNRIEEVLNSKNNHDMASMNQLQGDSKEWWANYIVPVLLSALNNVDSGLPKQAKDLLESWDQHYKKSSVGATIFWETMTILREKIVLDEMSLLPFGQQLVQANFGFLGLFWLSNILVNGTSGFSHNWFDNINTPAVETVSELIQAAFIEAITNLENKYSNKIDGWAWENYFKITFVHPLAASVPQLSFLSNSFSSDGGHCVRALFPTGGASLRFIKIFGEDGGVSLIVPPGASGNYFSKYYNNQMDHYINNEIYIWQSNPRDVKRELTQIVAFNP